MKIRKYKKLKRVCSLTPFSHQIQKEGMEKVLLSREKVCDIFHWNEKKKIRQKGISYMLYIQSDTI